MSEAARRLKLIVESWRGLPHSYSIVNMNQLAILSRRDGLELAHRDMPLHGQVFQPRRGLLPAAIDEAVYGVRTAEPDEPCDALLRMDHPFRVTPEPQAGRVFTFGTCELGTVGPENLPATMTLAEATSVPLASGGVSIITPSRWSRDGFARSGAKAARTHVIPHGVDPAIYKPADNAARARLREMNNVAEKTVFLHVGGMTFNKNIGALVRAFAALLKTHPTAHLIMKGTDSIYASHGSLDYELAMLGAASEAEVRRHMTYIGADLTTPQMADLYQAADVYLAPYRAEGFNLPVLEAAACGCTIVTSKGGPTDDFCHADFTLVVPARLAVDQKLKRHTLEVDERQLLQQMQRAASDTAFRTKAREAGPKHVHAQHTWTHAVEKLMLLLRAQ